MKRLVMLIEGGKRGGKLEADHYPKMFAELLKEYNIKSLEDADICEDEKADIIKNFF